ncbi:RagB/SusD family nutrient uptake outer membrane protein, partial [uncultured Parabacteroides sp.]
IRESKTMTWVLYDPESEKSIPGQRYDAKEPSSSGYVWKKYCDWSDHAMIQILDGGVDVIYFRYADVLLMHAEALLETKGIAASSEIFAIINQLRDRCGGGRVTETNYTSEDALRTLVRNERRVELANEGLRFFDIRRWKVAEKTVAVSGEGMNGEVYGAFMRLDGVGATDRTVMVDGVPRRYVETYNFDPSKHYLFPIPSKDIDLTNGALSQNPGWD